ncbi:MAG TPA: Uma2 family endonuclease [Blastocatellia bacterium]|nr:Uma2 family endonuclease [Blastocatellia bacterium]
MSTKAANYSDVIQQLPPGSTLVLQRIAWDEYEAALAAAGENTGFRLSYDQGTLQIMTISPEHESYTDLIQNLVRLCTLRLRIKLRSFGSATMKKIQAAKGSEPDCCFYVQGASLIGNRKHVDFAVDPPPDIVVEVDISHDSTSKFPIYAAFGVPEIWRYDGKALTIYHLRENEFVAASASLALPVLTTDVLTEFVNRTQDEDENSVLLAFEEWLQAHKP